MIAPKTAREMAGDWMKKKDRIASGVRWSLSLEGGHGGRVVDEVVEMVGSIVEDVLVETLVVVGNGSHQTATNWSQVVSSQSKKAHSAIVDSAP